MSLGVILEIVLAAFKFPKELSAFVRLISKSSEEKRNAIMDTVQAEARKFEETGRPSW